MKETYFPMVKGQILTIKTHKLIVLKASNKCHMNVRSWSRIHFVNTVKLFATNTFIIKKTNQLICFANQLTVFHMIGPPVVYDLKPSSQHAQYTIATCYNLFTYNEING